MTDQANSKNRYTLRAADRIMDAIKWLRNCGYVATVVQSQPESFTQDVLLFGRPGEPAVIATTGNTLVWDGSNVTVEVT